MTVVELVRSMRNSGLRAAADEANVRAYAAISSSESGNLLDLLKSRLTNLAKEKERDMANSRAKNLPDDSAGRKQFPVASGVLDYFPDAVVEVSSVSFMGNEQHNPGQPLHWSRGKSDDHSDTLMRHFLARGTRDKDGQRHSAKMAWRAFAILQLEIEAEQKATSPRAEAGQVDKQAWPSSHSGTRAEHVLREEEIPF